MTDLRRLTTAAIAVALLCVAPAAAVAQSGAEPPRLALMVTTRGADDSPRAHAGDSGVDRFDSFVWVDEDPCSVGAAGLEPSPAPWGGWRIGGRVMHRVDETSHMVEIHWQRWWEDGRRLSSGPMGFMQVVMPTDSSLLLDEIGDGSEAGCGRRRARLEATLGSRAGRSNALRSGLPDGPSISGGVISFRGVGGPRSGSGSGSISRVGARGGGGGGGGGGGRGGGRATPATADPAAVRRDIPAPDEIEVWLVHTLADGSERAQKQTVRLGDDARRYVFPPLRLVAGGRDMWFAVAGLVHLIPATDTRPIRIIVLIERAVTDSAGERLGSGGASRTFDLTAPGEVTSLELPGPTSIDLEGQRIEVRVVHRD